MPEEELFADKKRQLSAIKPRLGCFRSLRLRLSARVSGGCGGCDSVILPLLGCLNGQLNTNRSTWDHNPPRLCAHMQVQSPSSVKSQWKRLASFRHHD